MNKNNIKAMQFCDSYYQFLDKINIFNEESERLFLEYSSVFSEAHKQIKEQAKKTNSLKEIIDGVELASNMNAIQALLGSIEQNFKNSQNEFDNMGNVFQELSETEYHYQQLKKKFVKIIKILRMHVVSIKIKSSILKDDRNDFLVISSRIMNLVHNVESRLNDIENEIHSLNDMIYSSINQIEVVKNLRKSHLSDIESIIEKQIVTLEYQKMSINDSIGNIDELSNKINKYMYQVIMSVQAQDILRQEFSRIKKVFTDLGKTVSAIEEMGDELDDEQTNNLTIFLNHIEKEIKKLQEIQQYVFESTKTLEDAPKLLNNMQFDLKKKLDVYVKDSENKNSIRQVSKEFGEISKPFEEESRMIKNEKENIADIVQKCNYMNSFVTNIDDIENDIKIISINAQIKANEIDENGEPLEVLSSSIRNISQETKDISLNINKLIQNISSQSEKLQFEMDSDEVETKQKHVALLQQNITQFFENLNTLQDEITYEISDILTET
ncbi:MAG: methyl-accepting chemotaxis protein, partial [Candidatus Cloacimonadota bacterium]|nr:methyl-accepting chemotaxis protein [Candidatus Cloacimonadota bacterium]